ncbi:hypothetical protein BDV96DRAFT_600997 [Lophiotrema nucula]|uniref:FAD/NAD(P)-binding domain-containing protein n=1 Tax=Lophiotrema nucula TaxID=690887 RepID=A0A6A5Z629_9PLEO|nr:hypothetical protein BDV96DRAFT_600997 [Lophiotrema nucula]
MAPKVVIIGAGWAGLSAARTYYLVNPEADITILDDDSSVGGVWSSSRIYPGLLADSPRGLYEYSDLSMLDHDVFKDGQKNAGGSEGGVNVVSVEGKATGLDKPERYGLIRGTEVHNYLQKYAEKWDLIRRIRFDSKVVKAGRINRSVEDQLGWQLTLSTGETVDCDKLIVASGLYSRPSIPEIPGQGSFHGLSLHSKILGQRHQKLSDSSVKSVIVVGGCKSALETINLCLALPNKPQIHWVIRHGIPILFNDPDIPINLLALNNTRLFASFSPSIFDTNSRFYRFFHSGKNRFGTWLFNGFWNLMSWVTMRDAGYDKSEQGKLIKPNIDKLFQSLLYVSLIHKGNPVIDEIHNGERVTVHVGELDHVTPSGLTLRKGALERTKGLEEVHGDAIVWCTGWKTSTNIFEENDTADLGLPVPVDSQSPADLKRWQDLQAAADIELLKTFPALKDYDIEPSKEPLTNYRMYRQVISPSILTRNDRSISFAGFVSTTQTAFSSELTALWGISWMEGLLNLSDLPSEEEMEMDIARVHNWMARRYGARAMTSPEIVIEVQSYFDALVKELGCKVNRKGGWREYLGVYESKDYQGLIDEVLKKRRQK